MPRLRENLRVLGDRSFRRVLAASAVSWFGDRMVLVALPFAVLAIGGSASSIGLVLAVRTGAQLVCLLIGGVVADRVSRRAVMVVTDLVRLLTQGGLAALVIAGQAEVWSIALLAGLGGAASGFFAPASTGLLPTIVPAERLQQANGLRATAMSVGEIGGPVLAGVLVATTGAGWALAVDAASFGASAVLLAGVRVPARAQRAAASFWSELHDGWTTFARTTWVWTFVLWASLANVVMGAWSVLGPVVADRELGGAASWGAINAAVGLGALLGAVGAIRRMPSRPIRAAALTGFANVPAIALLAMGAPAAVVAGAAVAYGVGLMFGNTIWESALQRHVAPESLSRVSAYDWFGSVAFTPVGFAIWGPIAAGVGVAGALWISAALMLVFTALVLTVRDVRTLPADA